MPVADEPWAIDLLIDEPRRVLNDSSSPTIRSATYLMLGDVLKEAGQRDEALEVLNRGLNEALDNADRGR